MLKISGFNNEPRTFCLQMWINPCAQVIFDSDPAPKDISAAAGVEMMSQAMIRYILTGFFEINVYQEWSVLKSLCNVCLIQRNDGRGGKSVCGLLLAQWGNTSQAEERLWRGVGLYARGLVSESISSIWNKMFIFSWCVEAWGNKTIFYLFSGMITRLQENTTGTSKTKPAKVMRRTTSLSLETAMGFITMSWRLGKYSYNDLQYSKRWQWFPLILLMIYKKNVIFRVRLSKRRAKAGAQSTTNAVLVCKHRDMNEKELEAQVSLLFFYIYMSELWLRFKF